MKTLRLTVDADHLDSPASRAAIDQAAAILRSGGLVAFPTETVYGLGANALSAAAVERIFHAKQRPAWDPLIVHISSVAMLGSVVADLPLSHAATSLIDAFWPGPLTLLLPKSDAVPSIVTAGRLLVGVRMPAHPVTRALIAAAGVPIAAPSANTFGRISPTCAAHVLEDLDGRIDAVLDGGKTNHGLESTVVDPCNEPVILYRPGVISLEQIRQVCGPAIAWIPSEKSLENSPEMPESLPSPGVGIRHYAPRAKLVLIDGSGSNQAADFSEAITGAMQATLDECRKIGIMLPANFLPEGSPFLGGRVTIFDWGEWGDLPLLAHRLFAGLRSLDAAGVQMILCPLPPAEGIGAAIRDRLLKAAKK